MLIKYPRTLHLPWSNPGKDDKKLEDYWYLDEPIVVTEKMDGENTSLYRDGIHARSLTYSPHPSRDRLKAFHAAISYEIPEDYRLCVENCDGVHAIEYNWLTSLVWLISVWYKESCLSWEKTEEWSEYYGIPTVPVLYQGDYKGFLKVKDKLLPDLVQHEGYVVRPTREFTLEEFPKVVGKFVRPNHVTNSQHWSTYYKPNKIKGFLI